jgi:protein gp37
MADRSKIEWTDATFNPWLGCTKISAGCDHCYAEVWAKRAGRQGLWQGERRRTTSANWQLPHKWNKIAQESGERKRVFCASLADIFDNQVSTRWRDDLWHLIDQTPHLDWQLLTKRPQNIEKMLPDPRTGVKSWGSGWPNVWLGTSAENQEEADRRVPHLLRAPAVVRFVSLEPLLRPIDIVKFLLTYQCHDCFNGRTRVKGYFFDECCAACNGTGVKLPRLDWVIVGGESGPSARPMQQAWAVSLRDQCAAAEVAFFMKQMTKKAPIPQHLMIREMPKRN